MKKRKKKKKEFLLSACLFKRWHWEMWERVLVAVQQRCLVCEPQTMLAAHKFHQKLQEKKKKKKKADDT